MNKFLLIVHVLLAIVAIGPVTVAASMFPPSARKALAEPGDAQALSTVRVLHRICRVYATVGASVPLFGFATADSMGVLGDTWVIVSIVLTVLAAVVLGALVLPQQTALIEGVEGMAEGGEGAGDGGAGMVNPGAGDVAQQTTVRLSDVAQQATVRLAMVTGLFSMLWVTVTILMIMRPGSTTGA
ncbi:hypothetical protein AB0D57_40005 [Streptomyces sp. NPDC048275]|uniref:hypothetical protein n=1 Tax=Streptomyces sp. NPDC048275 TaxID=3155629 RepID=UPI00340DBF7F